MTTIAVTGHMDLTAASVSLVQDALRETLKPYAGDLTGVSCIAKGSDSIFAEVVIELGGRLVVVVPSKDYRQNKVKPDHEETLRGRQWHAAADTVLEARHAGLPVDVVWPAGASRRA